MRLPNSTTRYPGVERYLLPNERQLITVRQHPAVLIGSAVLALAGLIAALILNGALHGNGDLTAALWGAWLVLLAWAGVKTAARAVSYLVVTSDRLMVLTGLLNRRILIIPLERVNDISLRRSRSGELLGYGDFFVRYGGQKPVLQKLQYVPYPEQLCHDIRELILPPERVPCPACHGAGTVSGEGTATDAERDWSAEECPRCYGMGWVSIEDEQSAAGVPDPAGDM
jgi:Bacterial PH domain